VYIIDVLNIIYGGIKMRRKLCTRNIDEFGRIALPLEARTALGMKQMQSLDIYLEDDSVVISKSTDKPSCILCGKSNTMLAELDNNLLCWGCISKIKEL